MNPLDTTPRVHYPASEKKLMLVWYTHNEGTHIILAKTQDGLEKTFTSVSKKFSELPEVQSVSLIQTGRPSDELLLRIRQRRESRILDEFKSWIFCAVYTAVTYHNLPAPFFIGSCSCENGCDECDGYKFSLQGLSWGEAFKRGADTWVSQTKRKIHGHVYPDGSYVLPEEGLQVARGDFGHHSKGIVLEEAEIEYLPETPLFFYQVLENLEIPAWVLSAKALHAEQERRKLEIGKQAANARRRQARKKDEEEMALLTRLFS